MAIKRAAMVAPRLVLCGVVRLRNILMLVVEKDDESVEYVRQIVPTLPQVRFDSGVLLSLREVVVLPQ